MKIKRNVGFVPLSALLLDQNDDEKFRCNSAIEMKDYDRVNLRKMDRLDRIPMQTIKDELKAHDLANKSEIKEYLASKYGSKNEFKSGLNNNVINDKLNVNYLDSNYSKSIMNRPYQMNKLFLNNTKLNDLIDYNQLADYPTTTTLVPNKMPYSLNNNLSRLPLSLHSSLSANQPSFNNLYNNNSPINLSTLPSLPNKLSESRKNLASYLLINQTELNDEIEMEKQIEKELNLDEQASLLLSENDREAFNFYKNEFLTNCISLKFFVFSVCRLLNSPNKVSVFF